MTKVHREVLGHLANVRAVNLDTAYGFQENVPQMTEKLVDYFHASLHVRLEPLHFVSFEPASELDRALFKEQVRRASYVFAGPGSPSYAVTQWRPLGLGDDLAHVLAQGGVVCFASAAAQTLGAATAPIYEIYKAGAIPHWLPGLDLMTNIGLPCVIIPHFDNAEGATHDTRYCYLGERRLLELESQLNPGIATLGIDEHTALLIDLEVRAVTVLGRSAAYWRSNGQSLLLANGTTTPFSALAQNVASPVANEPRHPVRGEDGPTDLAQAVLEGGPGVTEALAKLVLLASRSSTTTVDAAPIIEGVLAARRSAREQGEYAWADEMRDLLVNAGVEVRDGPSGTSWAVNGDTTD